jgi:hypothetical protein
VSRKEYKPYSKPNNEHLYVHKESNHPPNIIKNIPEGINRRLSKISSNETIFNQASEEYQKALNKSGHNFKLKYDPPQNQQEKPNKTNRKRNITWYNPPYSKNIATNIGKTFIKIVDESFPPESQLHKIINRNTVKISYSCMRNMKRTIAASNKTKNQTEETETTKSCNCRNRDQCPLEQNCLTPSVVYQATVTRDDNKKEETYIGLTENPFKTRYNCHNSTFRNDNKRNATTLSQHIWKLKDNRIDYKITWKIIAKARAYSPETKSCNLCLIEKYYIIYKPNMATLNSRNELNSTCRHRKKYLLNNTG